MDRSRKETIVFARFPNCTTNHLSAVCRMMWDIGYTNLSQVLKQPFSTSYMTSRCHGTPKSKIPTNVTSLSFIKPKTIVTQFYDSSQHVLKIGERSHTMKMCNFEPSSVFHYEGIEFCYLCPFDSPVVIP